jgi:hypothetical protein
MTRLWLPHLRRLTETEMRDLKSELAFKDLQAAAARRGVTVRKTCPGEYELTKDGLRRDCIDLDDAWGKLQRLWPLAPEPHGTVQ